MRKGKIRILHVIKTLSLGGAETNLYNLTEAIDPKKFEVHVAYSFGGELEDRFLRAGVRLFKYAEGSHKLKSWASLSIVGRLARYILKNRIDIVHTHIFNAHVWGGLAARLTGRKVVEHVHDFRYLDEKEYRRRRGDNRQYRHIRLFRGLSDRVIVLTRQNRQFLLRGPRGWGADRVLEIKNGIPIGRAQGAPRVPLGAKKLNLGLSENARVVLTSARIAPEKNIELILRAAPRVLREVPETVFVILGDGPQLEDMRREAGLLGLSESFRFPGFCAAIQEWLCVSDVFLLPSFLELHSISILEAMSLKVPVVASAGVGCNDEVIRPWENGVLIDPFGDEGWAEAVLRLLKDEPLRNRIGENGYRTALRNFNIADKAKEIEGVYAELVPF